VLSEDAKEELVALMWIGRGDYTADAWDEAVSDAREMRDQHVPSYLIGTPLLGDLLEEGLSQIGRSCSDYEGDVRAEDSPEFRPETGPKRP
jgi:hypothetical protein